MIILILIILILLTATFAVRFAVGGKRGVFLPPASNRLLENQSRNKHTLPAPVSNGRRQKSAKINQAQPSTTLIASTHHDPVQAGGSASEIIKICVRKPILVKPDNSAVTVPSATVVRITPTVKPDDVILIKPRQAVIINPSTNPVAVVSPSYAVIVELPQRGAWDERGWTKQTDNRREIYEGYYQAGNRKFEGRIETRNRGRNVSAYIYDPPPEIKDHPHGACFQQTANGWFLLHWARPARNTDDAILYMERVLDESLNE